MRHQLERPAIGLEREDDGRWAAEVPSLPGVMWHGADRDEAVASGQYFTGGTASWTCCQPGTMFG